MSIELRTQKDGTRAWRVRWRENEANRSRNFTLKKDAEAWEREVHRRRQLGPLAVEHLTARGETLGQWVVGRWAPEHAATLAVATRIRYSEVYATHIAPWFEGVPLTEISKSMISAWQVERRRAGVNPGTLQKARTVLSSILRHAAEADAIMANPVSSVRAPRSDPSPAVRPLSPSTVEKIRAVMLNPPDREIVASSSGQRARRTYALPAPGTPETWQRDALIVSILAYAGLRPGELRALRPDDIREKTILIERATNPDGSIKATKNRQHRTVRLLAPLAEDIRAYAAPAPLLLDDDGKPWDKSAWQMWRVDRWAPACRAVGLDPVPRPYDMRHSFASLLLAEGRQPAWIAKQLGHTLAVFFSTYGHLIDEYADRDRVNAEDEIAKARLGHPLS